VKDHPSKGLSSPGEDIILSVILVNFNGRESIGRCLDSLEKNSPEIKKEIIVVDNHSTDGSVEFLQKEYPNIHLLRNSKNLGFSKANNQGLKASRGHYCLMINPDTLVYSDSIKKLLAEIESSPDIGGIGPALLNDKNNYQVSFGGNINFFSEAAKKVFLNRFYRHRIKKKPRKRDVEWLSGACFLFRRELLESVGMFDEKFFLYFEDIDLCKRVREKGLRLVYFPSAEVFHEGGASTQPRKLDSRFHYRKSQLYFYRKYSSSLSFLLLKVFLFFTFTFIFLQGFLKKNSKVDDRTRFFKLLGKQG